MLMACIFKLWLKWLIFKLTFLSCLQAGDVPVEFEEFHLSEVQNMASEDKLEQVLTSMKNNKVAMKGTASSYFKGCMYSTVWGFRLKINVRDMLG